MFDFMLAASANIRQIPHETISEKLAVGIEVTLRGMLTVFSVLILIWCMVEILHLILGEKTKPAKKKAVVVSPAVEKVTAAEPISNPTETPVADDYALIAVITAAVAAASGASPNSFRVVSFKRANNKFASGK